jgi:peptidoglycan/xylan/chitin deacetylase (PgdA/CDA1 family)
MRLTRWLLRAARVLGLLRLSRALTGRRLRILCYHGLMPEGLAGFRPDIFLRARDFDGRLRHLAEAGYQVMPLGVALGRLRDGRLPRLPVAITFDDGFYSFASDALPALRRHGYPATVYLNTEDCGGARPVFRLLIQYLFWRTERPEADLSGVAGRARWRVRPGTPAERQSAAREVVRWGLEHCSPEERQALAAELAARLGVDCAAVFDSRLLGLMRPEEVRAAARTPGIDVQLHTHRHRFPLEREAAVAEIEENRRLIREITGTDPEHFCYPFGEWDVRQWPWLAGLGLRSATTCDPGLNDRRTPPFALKRLVDGDDVGALEFEAEMAGLTDLGRRLARRVRIALSALKRWFRRSARRRPGPGAAPELGN